MLVKNEIYEIKMRFGRVSFRFSLNVSIDLKGLAQRNGVFVTNTNFSTPLYFQPN